MAVVAKTIGAPIDRIKMIHQCRSRRSILTAGVGRRAESSGCFESARYIFENEGFLGFWKGNFTNCLRYVPRFALDMSLKQVLIEAFNVSFSQIPSYDNAEITDGRNDPADVFCMTFTLLKISRKTLTKTSF